ncbi:MAG: response regulator [Limisphaerales bacterium]
MDAPKIILLVEDNEDDVFLTEIVLRKAGVHNRLLVARDGQEAVDYLSGTGQFANREEFPFPSLVLLDLQLPYRSGLEILAWMRSMGMLARTTVAVLTGSNEPRDLKEAYDLGTSTYLVKPPTPQMIYDIKESLKLDWLSCDAFRLQEQDY